MGPAPAAASATSLLDFGKRLKNRLKEFVVPAMIWEELGFVYLGPIDGHDVGDAGRGAAKPPSRARAPSSSTWSPSRARATTWPRRTRSSGTRVAAPGKPGAPKPTAPKFQDVFARDADRESPERTSASSRSPRPCPTARRSTSSPRRFPDRFFDVGIAEQHAVTFAAGLAMRGHEAGGARSTRPSCSAPTTR